MATTPKNSLRARKSIDWRSGEATWNAYVGFALYCSGSNYQEIGRKIGVSARTVCHRADKEEWDHKKAVVLADRVERVGMDVSKEQKFVRAKRGHMARQLVGLADMMIHRWKIKKPAKPATDAVARASFH
jgi:hypothetical protein